MRHLKSCGVLCFTAAEPKQFLLMVRHPTGYDLPKGHIEPGESELDCALREWAEETGLTAEGLILDPTFRFETQYTFRSKRYGDEPVRKTLVIFLAQLAGPTAVQASHEHKGWRWFPWPTGPIQKRTIDPLLAQVAAHWQA